MRVGIYVPDVTPEWGGAHTFAVDLLGALADHGSRHEFVVLHAGDRPPVDDPRLVCRKVAWYPPSSPNRHLDETAQELALELIWFLTPQYQPVALPFFATVWDLEHRNQPYFPEVSVSGWTWSERESFYLSFLQQATRVLTGTEEGRRQLERFYAIPSEHIDVLPYPVPEIGGLAHDSDPSLVANLGIGEPYLFYPAQFWPHKNHVVLLHAIRELNERHGKRYELVLTGADKGNLGHVQEIARDLGVAGQVHFLGFVEREVVLALYRNAFALIFPSFFGPGNLPPLEAFALGCPVVAAALPGTTELYGEAALLVDPRSERAFAAAVLRLRSEEGLRESLVQRGLETAQGRSPADYVRRVVELLDDFEPIRRCWSSVEPFVHL